MKKIIHLYWGRNKPLSFIRSLTVRSFAKLNPDWEVYIWTPSIVSKSITWDTGENAELYEGHDYLKDLEKDGFSIHYINTAIVGIPSDTPEVQKSDLLRWHILGEYGGVWSDFDVLYVNPITNKYIENWGEGAWFTKYRINGRQTPFIAIGFLMSIGDKGEKFFKALFDFGISCGKRTKYQAFGADLFNSFVYDTTLAPQRPMYFDPVLIYHYCQAYNIPKYWKPDVLDPTGRIGFHWYGGYPDSKEFTVQPENIYKLSQQYAICKEAIRICL